MNETTQAQYSTLPTLYIALELSNKKWKQGVFCQNKIDLHVGTGRMVRESFGWLKRVSDNSPSLVSDKNR